MKLPGKRSIESGDIDWFSSVKINDLYAIDPVASKSLGKRYYMAGEV
jgi:hypothetical protein